MSKLNVWNVNKIKEETSEKIEEKQKEEKYKPDDRIAKIYKAKRKYEKERRHAKFQEWLNNYTDKNISIREILTHLCREVFDTINKSGYAITNEKRLRDEIASFVYKECSNHA